jgi:hypothetical protein
MTKEDLERRRQLIRDAFARSARQNLDSRGEWSPLKHAIWQESFTPREQVQNCTRIGDMPNTHAMI